MMRLFRTLMLIPAALAMGAARPAPVALWRLDCGTFVTKGHANGCYLIHHGKTWMLWDAGLDLKLLRNPTTQARGSVVVLDRSLEEQLAPLGLAPKNIAILGISHVHFDHIGQASSFPKARLIVGVEDWKRISGEPARYGLQPEGLAPWIAHGGRKTLITGDYDVFGDGSVVMLALPGHTPGHHGLLVRMAGRAPIMLTGDLYDSAAQYRDKIPNPHEDDRAQLLESFRRFDDLAAKLGAQVIIQHEPDDIGKLPAVPPSRP